MNYRTYQSAIKVEIDNKLIKKYYRIATNIRKNIVKMHAKSNSSHIGSALSCVDILTVLYFHILKIRHTNPPDEHRDRVILSKGHAISALYATLAERGLFDKSILENYCADGSLLPGHSTKGCIPGVEVSTGSLGHGLPIGVGMAVASKHDNLKSRIFIVLSDGECDEGSIWEAALFATHHKLDNLIAIVDYNKIQAFGLTKEVLNLEPFVDKWKAFGWEVREIDGHNFGEIIAALKKVPSRKNKPSVIIAHTVKGKGISFMENKLLWHYKSPNKEELEAALQELK